MWFHTISKYILLVIVRLPTIHLAITLSFLAFDQMCCLQQPGRTIIISLREIYNTWDLDFPRGNPRTRDIAQALVDFTCYTRLTLRNWVVSYTVLQDMMHKSVRISLSSRFWMKSV